MHVCTRFFFIFFFFLPHHTACGILVPQPGTEPRSSAVKAQSPNHWTTREFPTQCYCTHIQYLQSLVFLWTLEYPKNNNTLRHNLPSWKINTTQHQLLTSAPLTHHQLSRCLFFLPGPGSNLGTHFAFRSHVTPFSLKLQHFLFFPIFHVFDSCCVVFFFLRV